MSNVSLPKSFRDLDKFVADWALPTEGERNQKRRASSMEVLRDFYNALLPRFGDIMSYLKGIPADKQLSAEDQRLLLISQSFVEASFAVERFGLPDVPDAFDIGRMVITPAKA